MTTPYYRNFLIVRSFHNDFRCTQWVPSKCNIENKRQWRKHRKPQASALSSHYLRNASSGSIAPTVQRCQILGTDWKDVWTFLFSWERAIFNNNNNVVDILDTIQTGPLGWSKRKNKNLLNAFPRSSLNTMLTNLHIDKATNSIFFPLSSYLFSLSMNGSQAVETAGK